MRPFGYHIVGGVSLGTSLRTTAAQGFSAAQIFLGPPQRPIIGRLSSSEIELFLHIKKASGMKVFCHAPYTIHAFCNPERIEKNTASVVQFMKVCSNLELDGFVLHMGGTKWHENTDPIDHFLFLMKALANADCSCPLLLENCASGNDLSGSLRTIRDLMDRVKDSYWEKGFPKLGICLDTCHAWAWGYNWPDEVILSSLILDLGSNLSLIHLNSATEKVTCGGNYDRHASLEKGVIPVEAFHRLLKKLPDVPVIVERDVYTDVFADKEVVLYADSDVCVIEGV